ncbi:putative PIG3 family NAD(P)H quinone oxidoreductase [Zhihengliuella halotolerans]|uniref:Putative PIG3 family NAD(P)H quinone oxidoreductase n=2 Tax=Zhihengliuella halotolerans TaxID=370736 RepID=A0A4V6MGE1_9MICC|nr:putative PIG3 family NAD(P)H quinone oxidoreductase [Zhihengliuella halotolerans]
MKKTMRAIEYTEAGGPDVINVATRPVPQPGPGEVLIKVAAAGLNRADVAQRRGVYPPPAGESDIPGLEVSGTVVERGPGVQIGQGYDDGAHVCALLAAGGYAEYVVAPVAQTVPVPAGVSLVDAAGLPEAAATVWSNLVMEAGIEPGERLLVHGASGGIGSAAIQIMTAYGVDVAVTGSTAGKLEYARELGADVVIDYGAEDFVERIREATNDRDEPGADVILDVVGAKYLERNVEALGTGGRLVVIGMTGGARAELDLSKLMARRGRIIATTLRARPAEEKARIMQEVREHVWPMITHKHLTVTTDRVFGLSQARESHEYFDSGEHRGKVLLVVD